VDASSPADDPILSLLRDFKQVGPDSAFRNARDAAAVVPAPPALLSSASDFVPLDERVAVFPSGMRLEPLAASRFMSATGRSQTQVLYYTAAPDSPAHRFNITTSGPHAALFRVVPSVLHVPRSGASPKQLAIHVTFDPSALPPSSLRQLGVAHGRARSAHHADWRSRSRVARFLQDLGRITRVRPRQARGG
jgi:hypothetical protein